LHLAQKKQVKKGLGILHSRKLEGGIKPPKKKGISIKRRNGGIKKKPPRNTIFKEGKRNIVLRSKLVEGVFPLSLGGGGI